MSAAERTAIATIASVNRPTLARGCRSSFTNRVATYTAAPAKQNRAMYALAPKIDAAANGPTAIHHCRFGAICSQWQHSRNVAKAAMCCGHQMKLFMMLCVRHNTGHHASSTIMGRPMWRQ